MPWHIQQRGSRYCVIKDSDGSIEKCHRTKAEAARHMAALYANTEEAHMNPDHAALAALVDDGDQMKVGVSLEDWTFADSGQPGVGSHAFNVKGYAAVFNVPSHDMGGFRTVLDRNALEDALADPALDVHFVWDHDTRYPLARTKNGTLNLTTDDTGLLMEAKVGGYTYAKDLRVALERGDIDQGSIALHIGEDRWDVEDDESITRTVLKASSLHDVTVTAQGAFPQTSLAVAYSLVKGAIAEGRLPETVGAKLAALQVGEEPPLPDEGGSEGAAELATWRQEQLHKLAVHRDEVKQWIERSKAL